ncbi:MAG: RnfABCDGE type electron transport complex subunit D [Candidatus Omnitrophica bacterium]|nr:RnfABCDGE type electron transport complex subunit D [Candidatus Omnitrophota bacterium]
MDENIILSPSPHIFEKSTTKMLMKDVLIALLPITLASIYFFRIKAVIVLVTCVISCVMAEYLFQKLMKKRITIGDYSAVVTGMLLAFVLPPATPFWVCVVGSIVSIILAKQIFGGMGYNIFNPALLGRAFLMAAFPTILTTWTNPITLDAVTGATPLGLFKFEHQMTGYWNLFIGDVGGSIGETSVIALLIGAAYLFYRKAIDYRTPVAYLATVGAMAAIMHAINPSLYATPIFYLLAGGLFLGAFFMATDPVTTPVTKKGRWIFGIGCGVVTMVIRFWGGLPEGVMYSILLMNAFTPLINKLTRPKRFGT